MVKEKVISDINFLRELIAQAPGFVIVYLHRQHEIYITNKALEELVWQTDLIGHTVDEIVPEFARDAVREKLDRVWETGEPYIGNDIPILVQPPGSDHPVTRYVDMIHQPLRSASGEMIGIYVQGVDVTKRREYEEEVKLLNGESIHRIKNIISVAKAIVLQTLKTSDDISSARQKIYNRLEILNSAQNAIAGESILKLDLRNIIKDSIATSLETFPNITIEGPSVNLPKRYCLPLSLTLHELATNALKYGALAVPDGALSIHWQLQKDGAIDILWEEKFTNNNIKQEDNSSEPFKKGRDGFGSKLIQRSLGIDVRNKISTDYKPDGFSCYIKLYLDD
ncbi:HWE histidine kinase domain-containing protein [Bartonella sp. HY038]|uniref:HWE histidine kinase domain-containing protein n=1 Tax=Bartonella sp. HY038 TaxID=2759660 RepID=UPI0015FA6799|nr:HWE histidine kinase domain-containing protein [Bartonella sp. HY038]